MKKIYYSFAFLFLFLFPLSSQAYVVKSSDFIYVAKDEIIEGNLYFTAKSVTIEGQVLGDVIGIGSNIQINGQIKGDLITIAQNININGKIEGNVRVISNALNIFGTVNKNINFLGESLILNEGSLINQDVLFKSINSEFNGQVNQNIHGGSNSVSIRGKIGQDVDLIIDASKKRKYLNSLQINETALISGSLNYQAGNDALIETSEIKGEINKKNPTKTKNKTTGNKVFYLIVSSFLIALIINRLFKKEVKLLKKTILEKNYKLIGYGSILLFLTPIAIFLLFLTIIGLPIAFISLFLWLILVYISRILTALVLGDYLFKLIKKEALSPYLKIITGIVLLTLLIILPYIGWIFSLLSILLGLGSIYYIIKNKNHVD
ncbi:MAG: polymer-forming cytoskeletal protein [Patescibacteria group bacterium]